MAFNSLIEINPFNLPKLIVKLSQLFAKLYFFVVHILFDFQLSLL